MPQDLQRSWVGGEEGRAQLSPPCTRSSRLLRGAEDLPSALLDHAPVPPSADSGCKAQAAGPLPFFFSTFRSSWNPSDRFRVRSTFMGLWRGTPSDRTQPIHACN